MIEIIMAVAAVVAMGRIADAEDQSQWAWVGITFALILLCFMLVPLPFVRIGAGFGLAFIGMIGYKVAANR
jgi:hypothetical protein